MDKPGTQQSTAWQGPLLAFLLAGLVLIGLDLADGTAYMIDVDDRMRALQIRDLLADGNWFDRALPFIDMPGAYVSPWSRLVDAPYYLLTLALGPVLGTDPAFHVATLVWPVALSVVFMLLAFRVMRLLGAGALTVTRLAVVAVLMIFALWDFVPGRIDHHNVQMVLMMAMLAGLADPRVRRGGLVAGVAATLSIAVGLECLPFVAVAFAALALAGAAEIRDARLRLQATGWGFGLSGVPAALALIGPQGLRDGACDALSGFWVAAIVLYGAIAALAPLVWRSGLFRGRYGVVLRLVSLALPAVAAAAVLLLAYPDCLGGPYHMIDPVSRAFWLDRVQQEGSIAVLLRTGAAAPAALLGIFVLLALLAVPAVWRRLHEGRYEVAVVWAVAASAAAIGVLQVRFLPFPAAFVSLFFPLLLGGGSGEGARRLVLPALIAPPLLTALWMAVFPPPPTTLDAFDLMTGDRCDGEDAGILADVRPGRIMAPMGLAFAIAEDPRGNSVAALSFHRASPGIRRVALAFTGTDAATRREGLEPFDYVAICRRQTDIDLSPAPLFKALIEGEAVPGLDPVAPQDPSRFRLFRIDKDAPDAFALPGD